MNGMDVLSLLALVAILGLLLLFVVRRFGTVEEGHVAVVHIFDRFSRTVEPGFYFLWPFEEEIARVNVRRREVPSLMIGGLFTPGGLPLSVQLAYAMRLVPQQMETDELYYSEQSREDEQIRIFRKVLQELIIDSVRPTPQNDKNSVDFGLLFSPFMGNQARQIRDQLEQHASTDLIAHGIELLAGTLVISRLHIPESIITAYTELLTSNFSSAARYQFIDRVRSAGGTMTDSGLVQLLNAIQENPGNIHSIFSTGSVQPDVRVQDDNVSVRMSAGGGAGGGASPGASAAAPNAGSPATASSQPSASQPANDDLPLTEEDMAMLRSLFD